MPEFKHLSENTRKLRKLLKETQEEFAENCGMGTGTLNAIERELTDPRLSSIQKIAAYTGWTVPELLSSEEYHNEQILHEERYDT